MEGRQEASQEVTFAEGFPAEVKQLIFSFLPFVDIKNVLLTCKDWQNQVFGMYAQYFRDIKEQIKFELENIENLQKNLNDNKEKREKNELSIDNKEKYLILHRYVVDEIQASLGKFNSYVTPAKKLGVIGKEIEIEEQKNLGLCCRNG